MRLTVSGLKSVFEKLEKAEAELARLYKHADELIEEGDRRFPTDELAAEAVDVKQSAKRGRKPKKATTGSLKTKNRHKLASKQQSDKKGRKKKEKAVKQSVSADEQARDKAEDTSKNSQDNCESKPSGSQDKADGKPKEKQDKAGSKLRGQGFKKDGLARQPSRTVDDAEDLEIMRTLRSSRSTRNDRSIDSPMVEVHTERAPTTTQIAPLKNEKTPPTTTERAPPTPRPKRSKIPDQ